MKVYILILLGHFAALSLLMGCAHESRRIMEHCEPVQSQDTPDVWVCEQP